MPRPGASDSGLFSLQIIIVLATIAAVTMVLLWPAAKPGTKAQAGTADTRKAVISRIGLVLVLGLLSLPGAGAAMEPEAAPLWHGASVEERQAAMRFMVNSDLLKAVREPVEALPQGQDTACARRLVMDIYHIPDGEAALVVELMARSYAK